MTFGGVKADIFSIADESFVGGAMGTLDFGQRDCNEKFGDRRHDTCSHSVVLPRAAVRRGGGGDIEREGLLHVCREERLQ